MTELTDLSLSEASDLLSAGETSSVELVKPTCARSKKQNQSSMPTPASSPKKRWRRLSARMQR